MKTVISFFVSMGPQKTYLESRRTVLTKLENFQIVNLNFENNENCHIIFRMMGPQKTYLEGRRTSIDEVRKFQILNLNFEKNEDDHIILRLDGTSKNVFRRSSDQY